MNRENLTHAELTRIKRTMAEIKADMLGIIDLSAGKCTIGRNTLYKMLNGRGYRWSAKYFTWLA